MNESNRWRTRRAALGALAAAALLALPLAAAASGPRVTHASGTVEIGSGEPPAWRSAGPGEPLAAGDAVRTGPGARAELMLGTRTVRLYENSLLRIPAEAIGERGPREVQLDRGRSIFDVLRDGRGDRFDVRTPEVVVSVKGTVFLVDAGAEGGSSVSVFRGQVGVRALTQALEQEVRVRPGFTAVGGAHPIELRLNDFENPWEAFHRGVPAPDPPPSRRRTHALEQAREAAHRAAEQGLALQERRLSGDDRLPTRQPTVTREGDVIPAKRAELEKVNDVMRMRMRKEAMSGALDAAIVPPDSTFDATTEVFLGDGSYTYAIREGDLLLFQGGEWYTLVDDQRIADFLDNSGKGGTDPSVLGAPMMHFMQEQKVEANQVRDFLRDRFGR